MKADLHVNKYRKVLLIAQRTKQLQNGAQPRVRLVGAKPSRIARTEVEQGLITSRGEEKQEGNQASPPPAAKKDRKK